MMAVDGALIMDKGITPVEMEAKDNGTLELIRLREEALADKCLHAIRATNHGRAGRSDDLSFSERLEEIDLAEKFHDKTSRLPRWTRRETLVLVEARKVGEARIKKNKEERQKEEKSRECSPKARPLNESKWIFISSFCKQHGVDREPNQCRKRWGNLFADYKRIREWHKGCAADSFWLMKNDARKESKLPASFDPEVFEALDSFLERKGGVAAAAAAAEAVFESGRPAWEEGRLSDIEHPTQEEDVNRDVGRGAGSSTPDHPDSYKDQSPVHNNGRKKRKRPFVEPDQQKDKLVVLLEHNFKVLSEYIEEQSCNNEFDRAERKEQADSLVSVLGKLASALEKITAKLQKA